MEQDNQPDIAAILQGDARAFAVLVDRYKNMVYTVALRMLKHSEEAEEVAQDTFIKVFKSLKRFKGDSKLSTWIYRIAYNTCLDRLKSKSRDRTNVALDTVQGFELQNMENALEVMIQNEKQELIRACVQQLAPKDAALLTLFYFEEKNLSELGKILKMKESAVKVGLFRARRRMAKILKKSLQSEIIKPYER
ncbi:MAG: sigma-70 family RNA polymerase sigma factor [Bacteroidota bacterium]